MSAWDWDDPEAGYEPHERSDYHDAMADRADDDLKRMKEDGTFGPWRLSGLPYSEWVRRGLEDAARAEGLEDA